MMSPAATHASGDTDAAEALIERVEAVLPQTQCTRCGHGGCRPYAEALVREAAPINRCPPGGQRGIEALAAVLGRATLPLDPACGSEADPGVAWIDPHACIGCARCLPVCPVDAIIGAARFLHTVYESQCNGCELCIASCPVDCIRMQPRLEGQVAPSATDNRRRHEQHRERFAREASARALLLAERKRAAAAR